MWRLSGSEEGVRYGPQGRAGLERVVPIQRKSVRESRQRCLGEVLGLYWGVEARWWGVTAGWRGLPQLETSMTQRCGRAGIAMEFQVQSQPKKPGNWRWANQMAGTGGQNCKQGRKKKDEVNLQMSRGGARDLVERESCNLLPGLGSSSG